MLDIKKYEKGLKKIKNDIKEAGLLYDPEVHHILVNINLEIMLLDEENKNNYERHKRNIKNYVNKLMKIKNEKLKNE